jgi:uncharacterized membrane protein
MSSGENRTALAVCAAVFVIHAALGLFDHKALRTYADLSAFDYALWTTAAGGPIAYVPFFDHSLFSEHFMPTLLILTPVSLGFSSPEYLIVTQALFHAGAGFLLYLFARRFLANGTSLALMVAFLLSRRSYAAVSSYFYFESAEPLLVFGLLLAWTFERRRLYWLLVILALGCKEDMAIYVAGFGLVMAIGERQPRLGLLTLGVAMLWLLVSMTIAIPQWRAAYSMAGANHFLEERYAVAGVADAGLLIDRLISWNSLDRIVAFSGSTAFLCFLSPLWAGIAVPGMVLNLVAIPSSAQAGLIGHFGWPILPWLFAAAVFGAQRVERSAGRWRPWVPWLIVAIALVDFPLPRVLASMPWRADPAAAKALEQLKVVPASASVMAQPNLVAHLPRRMNIHVLEPSTTRYAESDYVVITTVGDLWPFGRDGIERRLAALAEDRDYEVVTNGPLFLFRRRPKISD